MKRKLYLLAAAMMVVAATDALAVLSSNILADAQPVPAGGRAPELSTQKPTSTGVAAPSAASESSDSLVAGVATNVATGGDSDNAGALSAGYQHSGADSFIAILFNFGQGTDITGKETSFGSYLLNPGTAGKGFVFTASDLWWFTDKKPGAGLGGYANLGGNWVTWSDGAAESVKKEGSVWQLSLGLRQVILNETGEGGGKYSVAIELGPTLRAIAGPLGQDDAFLKSNTGSTKTIYWGGELTISGTTPNLQPFVRLTYISGEVEGLSKLQATLGVDVYGMLTKL